MHGATLDVKLCPESKPISPPDMTENMVWRQLEQLLVTGKGFSTAWKQLKSSEPRIDAIALMWLYTWAAICAAFVLPCSDHLGIFFLLWHDLATAWIATSQMMQKLLNLSYLWPDVDVNNVCIWATQPNSLCGQLRKITPFRLWVISSKSWWELLFNLPNSLYWIKEPSSVCLKCGHITRCLELAGIIFSIFHGSCASLF